MEQSIFFVTLAVTLYFFISAKIRYDVVAILSLLLLVVLGIIPTERTFSGLAHPAVITVAAVLVISKALQHSGLVDVIVNGVGKIATKVWLQIVLLCLIVAIASAFINNVGALAIIMPVALHLAKKNKYSPSIILMPIAFASILGGMITLIGTPPNIIISTFRDQSIGARFDMFDFAPVGASITLVGLLFVAFIGWRLINKRESDMASSDLFSIESYITEVTATEDSKLVGMSIYKMNKEFDTDVLVLGIIRDNVRIHVPSHWEEFHVGDVLIIEADTEELTNFINASKASLAGDEKLREKAKGAKDIQTAEAIVSPNSLLVGKSAVEMNVRSQYNVNILAIARQQERINKRMAHVAFKAGDVLLMEGPTANLKEAMRNLRCLPLAKREMSLRKPRRILTALGVFAAALFAVVLDFLPVEIAFSLAGVIMVLANVLPLKEVYTSIDWPVIILLAAMIPVGEAFETTGGATTVTNLILGLGQEYPLWIFVALLMTITMLLTNILNNAATVVLMAPIALNIAQTLGVSVDPFLMTIAVGASCAFLTPIGHQSNTLVMGPGGYKFSDYWKMGLPLTIIVILLGVPLILYFWPA